ncbi:MAG TPA: pyridoxamine 5'-phosphate oxidase family protein [Rhizomicrobium sp.]|nr:pyridoxamine 5'-phosphate oxidase family protein [Rhizomicrobium sp.]
MDDEKKAAFIAYVKEVNCGVISTADKEHGPEAAFISLAITPDFEIVFETLITSRKYRNLQTDPRAALVIGGHGRTTLQIEGLVDEPGDLDRDELVPLYYKACPQNTSHQNWPGLTYMRLRPRWVRYSDYGHPWKVEEYFLKR